jgi:predicted secreted protein
MKAIAFLFACLVLTIFSFGQGIIQSDTSISRTIRVNESFELQFLDWPGTGSGWNLTEKSDTTSVSIRLLKQVLAQGYKPIGGKYISVYNYTGLMRGNFLIEYVYGRPWLKEKLFKCILKVTVI